MSQTKQHPPRNEDRAVSLPLRYRRDWRAPFDHEVRARLNPGCRVLDIGSGRTPSVPPQHRPDGCEYVGLDLSRDELSAAGGTAYDKAVVADITRPLPELRDYFDLAISWQVFEHVRPLGVAAANIRSYLRAGGALVALLSGKFAVFALLNRVLPDAVGHTIVSRVMRRTADSSPVFPAYYDRCYAAGLRDTFEAFGEVTLVPFYCGAGYFSFSATLMKSYLVYENVIYGRSANLATHYLLVARL